MTPDQLIAALKAATPAQKAEIWALLGLAAPAAATITVYPAPPPWWEQGPRPLVDPAYCVTR
jgi:hypothetical protein